VGEYAPVTSTPDWRLPLLSGASRLPTAAAGRNPAAWPGYEARPAVTAWRLSPDALGVEAVAAVWDFAAHGGSFGEDDATALVDAAREAVRLRLPLLTLVRSGGTRLQEGMAALVGIPRARLALLDLAAAGLPHLSVADQPTTGGVWISVTSGADLRVAVEGATVGFAGPRVVAATTGKQPGPGSHTATSAYAAGLVDAALPAEQVTGWLAAALRSLTGSPTGAATAPGAPDLPVWSPPDPPVAGSAQVALARRRTTGGGGLLADLLEGLVPMRAPGGDLTVAAGVGRLAGRPVVGVAVAAQVGGRPTPAGYRLAARAYRLAGRLGLPVLSLVDTPGAEPGTSAEEEGIAPAMGDALEALLTCPSPTVALVHGEGGSGGALAAACADLLLLTPDSYFAAIGPEGASAALRRSPQECADLMRITPADLISLGAADAVVEDLAELAGRLASLDAVPDRLARRRTRWSSPVPHHL
jgi:hypothetical protein